MAISPKFLDNEFSFSVGGFAGLAIFNVVENGDTSRNITPGSIVDYEVSLATPSDTQWSTDIDLGSAGAWEDSTISEELIIAANTWHFAGWVHMDDQLIKKWPPECVKISPNSYRVSITYQRMFVVDFQIAPQKGRLTTSHETAAYVFDPEGADGWYPRISFKNMGISDKMSYHMINTNEDGAEGVDIVEPSFTWTERWTFGPVKSLIPAGKKLEDSYQHKMVLLTGKINKNAFRGYPSESVLFMGGVGRNVAPLTWEFDYKFSHRPKRELLSVGPLYIDFSNDFYSGWNFVDKGELEDVELQQPTATSKGRLAKIPRTVKLHKVYKTGDFNDLGIAEKVPLGYGTPADEQYLDDIPTIGEEWELPAWGRLL